MKRFLFLALMGCMGWIFVSHAQTTDISTMDNALYIVNSSSPAGSQVTLSLQMKNAVTARGFQCDLYLPEGMSFVKKGKVFAAALSTERTTSDEMNSFSTAIQEDGSLRILCNSTVGCNFSGNSGEVATVTVKISENVAAGPYTVTVKNAEISDPQAKGHRIDQMVESSIQVTSYDKGYSLSILPFKIESATSVAKSTEISLAMQTLSEVASVRFDIYWSKSAGLVTTGKSAPSYDEYEPEDEDENYVEIDEEGYTDGAGISFTADDVFSTSYQSIISMKFRAPKNTADTVTQIRLENIVMTDKSNKKYYAAPYSATVFVGGAKAEVNEGKVAFAGDYSSEEAAGLLKNAIPTDDAAVTEVDLTGVTSLPENTEIEVANPNALITTKTDLGLANKQNVIVGETCANLVISSDGAFNAPFEFTATQATFSRTLTGDYGTICLPYAPSTDYHIFYELVTSSDTKLCFNTVTSPKANTPYLYAREGSSNDIVSSNVTVSAGGAAPAEVGEWKMVGTYEQTTLTDNVYFLGDNNLIYRNTGSLTIPPFRAYFIYETGAPQSVSVFIDSKPTNLEILENGDVVDGARYNVYGQPVDGNYKGLVIMNGKIYNNK